jgi:deoxyribodipyrimidine photo-lyase
MPDVTHDVSVVWFRRDLRLHDHRALAAAAEGATAVAPLFVLDDALTGEDASSNRLWFMLGTLRGLAADLERRGSRLHVRVGRPDDIVPAFARDVGASRVHVSRDFSPYGRRRDLAVHDALLGAGVAFGRHPGVLVHEPEAIAGRDGTPYTVYSPFRRAWDRLERRGVLAAPDRLPPAPGRNRGR